MHATSLVVVCVIAFAVVAAVLTALAASIRLLTILFPARVAAVDAAVVAAVSTAAASLIPGARVTRIEEEP